MCLRLEIVHLQVTHPGFLGLSGTLGEIPNVFVVESLNAFFAIFINRRGFFLRCFEMGGDRGGLSRKVSFVCGYRFMVRTVDGEPSRTKVTGELFFASGESCTGFFEVFQEFQTPAHSQISSFIHSLFLPF